VRQQVGLGEATQGRKEARVTNISAVHPSAHAAAQSLLPHGLHFLGAFALTLEAAGDLADQCQLHSLQRSREEQQSIVLAWLGTGPGRGGSQGIDYGIRAGANVSMQPVQVQLVLPGQLLDPGTLAWGLEMSILRCGADDGKRANQALAEGMMRQGIMHLDSSL
jgi:hypothetical protein